MNWQVVIENTVKAQGLDPVACERQAGGLLRVLIDRLDGSMVTIDDCERVTRQLQFVLEVEGVDYARLEVSSPGLDRPLRRPADFERFLGHEADITLKQPLQRRKRFRGVLARAEHTAVPADPEQVQGWSLHYREGNQEMVLGFTLDEIREARLVPVIDFKGRRQPSSPAVDEASAAGKPQESGGRSK